MLVAQNLKRANHLFEKRSYIEAAELLQNEDDKTQEVLEKLGDCYFFNSNMEEASIWYAQLFSEHESTTSPIYTFRYVQALKGIEKYSEADEFLGKKNGKVKLNTLEIFEKLNSTIERPYIIHEVSENTIGSDFGTSFHGKNIVFASTRNNGEFYEWNNQPYLDLFTASVNEQEDFVTVTSFPKTINTKVHESNAVFTKDGKKMYFNRNNFADGKKKRDNNKVMNVKIYSAELIENEWKNITELPFNDDSYSTSHPALSPNEKQLYFSSDMPGTLGSMDLFVVEINENGTYGIPINLGASINTEQREQFPFISKSNTLYFASDGHFGLGGLDIFKSTISDNGYGKPINMSTKINSNLDDFAFIINEENETGYFSSNREGGKGDDDIYRFTQLKKYYVNGLAKDKNTLELIPQTIITLTDSENNQLFKETVGNDAAYTFEISPNKSYIIKGEKELFQPAIVEFTTDNNGNINKDILLFLESFKDAEEKVVIEDGKTQIKINPIFFDFDKWNVRSDAALELNNVVSIMKKYPELIVEIGAHTDVRGSEKYNLDLSRKRANSVREYIISQGINTDNIKSIGYGESQPKNQCIEPYICKEEEYDINRRCEFVILN